MSKEIITHFPSRDQFEEFLKCDHPGIFLQFTATWCAPCKRISPLVKKFMLEESGNIICCKLDVDENGDLYSYLKRKRLINGIPCLYYYDSSNHTIAPSLTITGGDINAVANFLKNITR